MTYKINLFHRAIIFLTVLSIIFVCFSIRPQIKTKAIIVEGITSLETLKEILLGLVASTLGVIPVDSTFQQQQQDRKIIWEFLKEVGKNYLTSPQFLQYIPADCQDTIIDLLTDTLNNDVVSKTVTVNGTEETYYQIKMTQERFLQLCEGARANLDVVYQNTIQTDVIPISIINTLEMYSLYQYNNINYYIVNEFNIDTGVPDTDIQIFQDHLINQYGVSTQIAYYKTTSNNLFRFLLIYSQAGKQPVCKYLGDLHLDSLISGNYKLAFTFNNSIENYNNTYISNYDESSGNLTRAYCNIGNRTYGASVPNVQMHLISQNGDIINFTYNNYRLNLYKLILQSNNFYKFSTTTVPYVFQKTLINDGVTIDTYNICSIPEDTTLYPECVLPPKLVPEAKLVFM